MGRYPLNELQFLVIKSMEGNLIIINSVDNSMGDVLSVTPAIEERFVFVDGYIELLGGGINTRTFELINGVAIRETHELLTEANNSRDRIKLNVKGDTLLGDGSKKYQYNILTSSNTGISRYMMEGYFASD